MEDKGRARTCSAEHEISCRGDSDAQLTSLTHLDSSMLRAISSSASVRRSARGNFSAFASAFPVVPFLLPITQYYDHGDISFNVHFLSSLRRRWAQNRQNRPKSLLRWTTKLEEFQFSTNMLGLLLVRDLTGQCCCLATFWSTALPTLAPALTFILELRYDDLAAFCSRDSGARW